MLFSHSRLSSFENCPRQFAFRYVEKVEVPDRQSVEAFMGSAVHEVLEEVYKAVQMERTPKWEETRDLYEAYWAKNFGDNVFIVRTEYTADDYRNVGRRCLQDYFVRHFPFRQTRTLSIEEHVHLDLDGTGTYKLQGYIDRLAQTDDGTIEIHDYKTSRRLPSQAEIDRERQLALYQLAIEKRWNDVPGVRLIWHYLRADRALVSVRSRESLEDLRTATMRLIDQINETIEKNDFPPHETMLCEWCDFQALCPAKRHLFATAAMTPQEFSADDGVRIADRFTQAANKKKEADLELQQARDEVVAFVTAQNLTRIIGHNATVGVSRRADHTLPNANTPEREELETLVRASGQWEAVSELSRSKLPKALAGETFDAESRRKIGELLRTNEIVTVRQSRLKPSEFEETPDV